MDSVGIPCAVAVKQVLDGTISETGVLAPMNSKINDPLMKELKVNEPLQHSFVMLIHLSIRTTASHAKRRSSRSAVFKKVITVWSSRTKVKEF